MIFQPYLALCLFPAMLAFLVLGRRIRRSRATASNNSVVDSAIFALFGLLLAFTFSGAVTRYDTHRKFVVEEANNIGTAYLRLDLLSPSAQPPLRQLFRDYVTSRLYLYDAVITEVSPESARLQHEIWKQSVAAAAPGASPDAARLLLPAVNDMIDITSTRQNSFNMHPPRIVYYLLFTLSLVCALLAGYSMEANSPGWMHMITLALAVTLTIYATLEIEFPSQGLLRLKHTDQLLVNLRSSMN